MSRQHVDEGMLLNRKKRIAECVRYTYGNCAVDSVYWREMSIRLAGHVQIGKQLVRCVERRRCLQKRKPPGIPRRSSFRQGTEYNERVGRFCRSVRS